MLKLFKKIECIFLTRYLEIFVNKLQEQYF